jgi:hypothetical protein
VPPEQERHRHHDDQHGDDDGDGAMVFHGANMRLRRPEFQNVGDRRASEVSPARTRGNVS